MNIAIVGAPTSGKRWLTRALAHSRPDLRLTDSLCAADRALLMGLDLAPPSPAQTQADAALREQLGARGIAYGVVYGRDEQRLRNALRLLQPEAERPRAWQWVCEKCADPDCEHKLFTALNRSTAADRPPR